MFEDVLVKDRATDYEKIVIDTFFHGAVRTALLIDDEFPTLADFLGDRETILAKYKQASRAVRLYKMFKSQHILCDVENDVSRLKSKEGIDRIRKSDLIVLDFHLRGEKNPANDCMDIVSKLADTSHFNVVVLLTAADNLTEVWLDLASNLRGAWTNGNELTDDQAMSWESIGENEILELINETLFLTEAVIDQKAALSSLSGKKIRQSLEEFGVKKGDCSALMGAAIAKTFEKRMLAAEENQNSRNIRGSCSFEGAKWLLCENVFIVVVRKPGEGAVTSDKDPENIMKSLAAALAAWKPNVIQIILSEIQNKLEMGAFASDKIILGSQNLQTGLIHYILSDLTPSDDTYTETQIRPAGELLLGKLMEGLTRRINYDQTLTTLASDLLAEHVNSKSWLEIPNDRKSRPKAIMTFSKKIIGDDGGEESDEANIIFELNSFLSTEKFSRDHISTGTIFRQRDEPSAWWICMSPACDMTSRAPSEDHKWHHGLHPFRGMVAMSITPTKGHRCDLEKAHFGRAIYLKTPDGPIQFKVFDKNDLPVWEFMILRNAGAVQLDVDSKPYIEAKRILRGDQNNSDVELKLVTFDIIGQLRADYASRLLQATGGHLSRIGIDYSSISK
jgi:hypothetical protein